MHVRDLALHALGVRGDTQASVRERGVQAARQSAVLTAIAKCAGETGVAPARVAAELGMSVRYLHRLLEPTGRTFAEQLLERRLDRAAAMLRDPGCDHLKIGDIARARALAISRTSTAASATPSAIRRLACARARGAQHIRFT